MGRHRHHCHLLSVEGGRGELRPDWSRKHRSTPSGCVGATPSSGGLSPSLRRADTNRADTARADTDAAPPQAGRVKRRKKRRKEGRRSGRWRGKDGEGKGKKKKRERERWREGRKMAGRKKRGCCYYYYYSWVGRALLLLLLLLFLQLLTATPPHYSCPSSSPSLPHTPCGTGSPGNTARNATGKWRGGGG